MNVKQFEKFSRDLKVVEKQFGAYLATYRKLCNKPEFAKGEKVLHTKMEKLCDRLGNMHKRALDAEF